MSHGPDAADGLRVDCRCGQVFHVARSLSGGLANCPACGLVNDVPADRPEWLFVLTVGAGVLAVLVLSGLAWMSGGLTAGLITLAIGGAILGGALLAL